MSEDTGDDDAWPFESMSDALSMDRIRSYVSSEKEPLTGIEETISTWRLDFIEISKNHAKCRAGWDTDLLTESRFFKQWFDFPDINACGWAVIFRHLEPKHGPGPLSEYFAGWVPPEREADADRWIAFLNSEIQARLAGLPSSNAKP